MQIKKNHTQNYIKFIKNNEILHLFLLHWKHLKVCLRRKQN